MTQGEAVTIHVKRGVKVNVKEVDTLEGDRQFVAETPAGLKVAIHQAASRDVGHSLNKITMCG